MDREREFVDKTLSQSDLEEMKKLLEHVYEAQRALIASPGTDTTANVAIQPWNISGSRSVFKLFRRNSRRDLE
jgi:hypothetical protein